MENYQARISRILPPGCFFPLVLVFLAFAAALATWSVLTLLIMLPIAILFITMEEGIEIDWDRWKFRNYRRFLIKTGQWKALPSKIKGVKISSANESFGFNSPSTIGASRSVKVKAYLVKLVYDTNKGERGIMTFKSHDKAECEQKLEYFKSVLSKIDR